MMIFDRAVVTRYGLTAVELWSDSQQEQWTMVFSEASGVALEFYLASCEIGTAGSFNTLNAELNPICHLLALFGAHHILHVSR